jgi:hypothetical protein
MALEWTRFINWLGNLNMGSLNTHLGIALGGGLAVILSAVGLTKELGPWLWVVLVLGLIGVLAGLLGIASDKVKDANRKKKFAIYGGVDPWSPEVQARRAAHMKAEADALKEQLAAIPPSTGLYVGKTPGTDEPGHIEVEDNEMSGFDHAYIVMSKLKSFRRNKASAPKKGRKK